MLALLGAGLLAYAAHMAAKDFGNFASMQTLRDLYTPVLLSFLLLPFIFVMHVFMSCDTGFRTIGNYIPDQRLRRFARLRALLSFGPSVKLLRRWVRNLGTQRPDEKDGIRQSIREVKVARKREKNPTPVSASQGWSPNIAKNYLAGEELACGDYHRSYDEWFASSPYLELGEGLMPDTAGRCGKSCNNKMPKKASTSDNRLILYLPARSPPRGPDLQQHDRFRRARNFSAGGLTARKTIPTSKSGMPMAGPRVVETKRLAACGRSFDCQIGKAL